MSIEKIQRANGVVWRVRWRDAQGRAHSRAVGRKGDAEALDAELRRAKRIGGSALVSNSREHWPTSQRSRRSRHAEPNLQRHTLQGYASALDVHIVPRLGDVRLQALTPELISDMRAAMAAAGIGEPAIRKTLVLLQSILERAVEWRRIDSNPARAVRKPSQRRTRIVRPLSPQTVEAIRAHLLATSRMLDATLVSTLAYAGLRPGEAIGLRWNDIGRRTLLVERSVAFGQLKSTKTASTRTVRLLGPLAEDFAAWQRLTPRARRPTWSSPRPTVRHGTPSAPATGASASSPRPRSRPARRPLVPMTFATASSVRSSLRAPPSSMSPAKPATHRP